MMGEPAQGIGKRLLDLVLSGILLVLLAPLLVLLAGLVRISSPGPVFFRQARLGLHGHPFQIFKFRTMFTGAADVRNADGSTFNSQDDPRVTPLGKWLRKTSLDELPQLFNVVLGDMSLVGPRPDLVDQLRFYTEEERRKLAVRPGITGLAQISGRNSIPWEERKRLDLLYVTRQGFWFDLKLLLQTVPYVLLRRGVYVRSRGDQSVSG